LPIVLEPERDQLAVLGSPIGHSRSPVIHKAAYAALGLDWGYGAADVTGSTLSSYLDGLGVGWRGLSLTMPLKQEVLPLLTWRDPLVDLVGAANTVSFVGGGVRGFNTDVYGVERSFRDAGIEALSSVHVLGAGGTALSVVAAVAALGATSVTVSARTPSKAGAIASLGASLGVDTLILDWGADSPGTPVPDVIVNTVPGGRGGMTFSEELRRSTTLFDVVYDPWPTELAASWLDVGGAVISGRELLINQAVGQVRIFVSGDPRQPLEHEAAVLVAMRSAFV
jgi:shikimate dehydrogenase